MKFFNYHYLEDDNEDEDWFYEDGTSIQCCLCGKWRFLGEISEREMAFIEYWDCSMNSDKRYRMIFVDLNFYICYVTHIKRFFQIFK